MIWLSVLLFMQASAADKQIERGQTLFFAEKGCGTCHALKGKGTAVGPDLRALGKVGVRAVVTAIRASRTEYVETIKLKEGDAFPAMKVGHDGHGHAAILRSVQDAARVAKVRSRGCAIEVGQFDLEAPAIGRRLHQRANRGYRRLCPLGGDWIAEDCGSVGRGVARETAY